MTTKFHDGICGGPADFATNDLETPGSVYYCSSTGDDNNTGARVQPFLTIATAVSAATDGDMIVLLDGFAETLTAAVAVSKTLTIVGEGGSAGDPSVELTLNHASANLFTVTGEYVTLQNIKFMASAQAATGHKVAASAAAGLVIRDCYFAQGANDSGRAISLGATLTGVVIEDTYVVATSTTTRPSTGLVMSDALNWLSMKGCVFDGGTVGFESYAMDLQAATHLRASNVSLLRSATVFIDSTVTGYHGIYSSTGDSLVIW